MTENVLIPAFDAKAHLQDGWKVQLWKPGHKLSLSQSPDESFRRIKRQLLVVAVSTLMGVLLLPDLNGRLLLSPVFILPVSALFFVVAVLGLFSLFHSYRAFREGIHLVLDTETKTAAGTSSQLLFKKTEVPFSHVERILLRIVPASKPQEPAIGEIFVDTQSPKFRLSGPTSWALENDISAARDHLTPLALEMARLIGCSLRIEYVDTQETDELSREDVLRYGTTFPSSPSSTG